MEGLSSNTMILVLGIVALGVLTVAVIMAAMKHALVQQLQSKNDEMKQVIDENTKNIANKAKLLRELQDTHDQIKSSLQDLSERHTALKQDNRALNSRHEKTLTNYEESQKNYLQALQSIADTKREMDVEIQQQKDYYEDKIKGIQSDAAHEVDSFKSNYQAEFDHLKKSHKRLVQANQTLSKNIDNLRDERDFYRTEFETLRDFLHDAQMRNVKELVAEKEKELAEKVVTFANKQKKS
ncbi:MAG: hypothetical protein HWD86_06675 [Kangiellaceae bacterium]|nr:hypothetical protein [Kangiellaceae bacterium]